MVTRVDGVRPGVQELTVRVGAAEEPAMNYTDLLGELQVGERVLLNTTAMRAELGTGGYHFVMKRTGDEPEARRDTEGHIVKLRYTPLQFRCRCVEEQGSSYRKALEACEDLGDMPVVAVGLHSQIAPAAAAVKGLLPEAKVAYVMTDTAALPLAFSKLVTQLKEVGLVDASITVGQAFGGDYEAVNVFSGLLAARAVVGADVAIVGQGPGNVGTETEWGFGSIAQGDHLNAIGVLEGFPIAVALTRAVVSIPEMAEDRLEFVRRQLDDEGITTEHEVLVVRGQVGLEELERRGVEVKSMGRTPAEDPEFFLAAGAGGAVAAQRLTWTETSESA